MIIGFDIAHGGKDPGAVGLNGLLEKDVSLGIGAEICSILKDKPLRPIWTRVDDVFVSLRERTNHLNSTDCDYAVSIHCNASENRSATYISTFIQGKGGEAEKLATVVQAHLVKATGWPDGGVRVSNLHMTRETMMPAILCECGFISNPGQEALLGMRETQQKIAKAICDGLLEYLGVEELQDIKIFVGDKEVIGKLINNRAYVPLVEYEAAKQVKIVYDEKDKTVTVK